MAEARKGVPVRPVPAVKKHALIGRGGDAVAVDETVSGRYGNAGVPQHRPLRRKFRHMSRDGIGA